MLPHVIPRITLMLTRSCNLHCVYCFQGDEKPLSSTSLERPTPKKVAEMFPKQGRYIVYLFGGEPFLEYDYMMSIVRELKMRNSDLEFTVATNASMLTVARAKELNEFGVAVSVSHDGYNFEKTRGVKDFLKENPEPFLTLRNKAIRGTVSVLNPNFYDIWDYLLEFKEKHGLNYRVCCSLGVAFSVAGNVNENLLMIDNPKFEAMLDRTFEKVLYSLRTGDTDNYEFDRYAPWINIIQDRVANNNGNPPCSICGNDVFHSVIDVWGNLYPCPNITKPCGQFTEGGLRPGGYNQFITSEECQNCQAFILCGGGCYECSDAAKSAECYAMKAQFSRLVNTLMKI